MKTIMLICALLFASMAQAQISKLDEIFEQYKEQKGVTSIKIGKPMFKMLGKMNIDDADLETIRPLLSKINSIKMLIVEGGDQKMKSSVTLAVDKLNYEELMVINSDGNKIRFLAKSVEGDLLNNLLLSIVSDEDTIFMILDGAMKYDDINNLVSTNN
ncbi:DUF4252 domain-containing protein [Sphingobacterium sp. DK4209]|uniref:DUF4252 domain-containing protein n=1 Tax=Sphingobacterium zhuxiongii TaxID=2662364 RepID=A0A5Q0Q661_9SPHI|nr:MULTISPECIES: DUF4252 domain-containing protein [unclassified Sphingobacterium]MVZ66884.1 DUF4252 domain-containing protein [Sphingobacterium sp. DK4209]QGA25527.1 DUF4252 domain-containing protein [Sphingobacterium sp. dk4302]